MLSADLRHGGQGLRCAALLDDPATRSQDCRPDEPGVAARDGAGADAQPTLDAVLILFLRRSFRRVGVELVSITDDPEANSLDARGHVLRLNQQVTQEREIAERLESHRPSPAGGLGDRS